MAAVTILAGSSPAARRTMPPRFSAFRTLRRGPYSNFQTEAIQSTRKFRMFIQQFGACRELPRFSILMQVLQ